MRDFHIGIPEFIPIYYDNKATIHIVENPVYHEWTKHINVGCHFVRDYFTKKFIKPLLVPSSSQLANIFTKTLGFAYFQPLLFKLKSIAHYIQLEGGMLKYGTLEQQNENLNGSVTLDVRGCMWCLLGKLMTIKVLEGNWVIIVDLQLECIQRLRSPQGGLADFCAWIYHLFGIF